jgi:hypothetical protein
MIPYWVALWRMFAAAGLEMADTVESRRHTAVAVQQY